MSKNPDIEPATKLPAQQQQQPNIIESLHKYFPQEGGQLLLAIKDILLSYTGSNPEQVKAQMKIESRVTLGFMIMVGAIIGLSFFLALAGILSGETIAFIFGTSFGSIVTFLYKFLVETED